MNFFLFCELLLAFAIILHAVLHFRTCATVKFEP